MLPVDEVRLNFNPASLIALNAVLGFLMFGIALDTRVADFKRVLRELMVKRPRCRHAGLALKLILQRPHTSRRGREGEELGHRPECAFRAPLAGFGKR